MTQYGYHNNKQKILTRLHRAEGQVRGISKMVQQDEYCIDILTQVSAVKSAIDSIALELIRDHAAHCLSDDAIMPKGKENKTDELVSAIGRIL